MMMMEINKFVSNHRFEQKTAHQGNVRKSVSEFNMLQATFDGFMQQDRCCTICMLSIELKRLAGNENVSLAALSMGFK